MSLRKTIMIAAAVLIAAYLLSFCREQGSAKELVESHGIGQLNSSVIYAMMDSEKERAPGDSLMQIFQKEFQKNKRKISNKDLAILIDYDLPVIAFRLWLIDMKNDKILLNSRVAHAYNSGLMYAESFSNTPNTEKSCVGSFVTGETYFGKYGYSMRITGLDRGFNDKALERYIVFHAHESLWSLGCFMTKESVNKQLIDKTNGGCFVYVHKANPVYSSN